MVLANNGCLSLLTPPYRETFFINWTNSPLHLQTCSLFVHPLTYVRHMLHYITVIVGVIKGEISENILPVSITGP